MASDNSYFSFHRPGSGADGEKTRKAFVANLQHLAQTHGFDAGRVTMPNGPWPHSGRAITAEAHRWVRDPRTGVQIPLTSGNDPVTYDAVITKSSEFVLAVQGADCPAIFFFDPVSRVIGLAHAGWKPLVRGVIKNTLEAMGELGANPETTWAFIAPSSGDRYTAFQWDNEMEADVRSVFLEAGREDLLSDRSIRHEMTEEDLERLSRSLGRPVSPGSSLMLAILAAKELQACGVSHHRISQSFASGIVDQYPETEWFQYHSYRRERPAHGLSISILCLQDGESPQDGICCNSVVPRVGG